jgi:hypothetical protein
MNVRYRVELEEGERQQLAGLTCLANLGPDES